ncbi:TetR/AcrR family transcriptional regulator [Winogradskya consettensis]|uniref:TetR family transcriptional regulator n=2 Tax=Winogradskya consettensis TaxID=113560 RepID=A0A919VZ63_9ACTN|nr:TetR family transcriptional regulator [Actinoplanes consettensis]
MLRGMPRLNTDTREEVKAVALELFSDNGFEQTSLREIAERLGITKAALYYHFASKKDLLNALLEPLLKDVGAFLDELPPEPRGALEAYFDLCYTHRRLFLGLLRDVQVMNQLDLVHAVIGWRTRLDTLLAGPEPADRVRAVVALGGLQDTVILFADHPDLLTGIRTQAIAAALRALQP